MLDMRVYYSIEFVATAASRFDFNWVGDHAFNRIREPLSKDVIHHLFEGESTLTPLQSSVSNPVQ